MAQQRLTLQPAAEPVDAYVRPATPARSRLWDLAEGLQDFDSGLQTLVQQRKQQAEEEDAIRGEAAFYAQNEDGYAEGVRTGRIPAFASRSFVRAYRRAEGGSIGRRLNAEFAVAYAQWDGKNSEDPAAFDTFLQSFLADKLDGIDDPGVLAGVLPHVRQFAEQYHQQHIADRSNAVYDGSVNAHIAEANAGIDDATDAGLASESGQPDYEAIWANLTENRRQALASGIRAEDYDKQIIDAITAKAIEHGDPDLLNLLDRSFEGTDYAISDTPYGRDERTKAQESITRTEIAREEAAYRQSERDDKAAKEEFTRQALEHLASDPNAAFDEDFLKEGSKFDPEFRSHVIQWRKTIYEGGAEEDPSAMLRLYEDIRSGGGDQQPIIDALEAGVIRSPGAFREALAFAKSLKDAERRGSTILTRNSVTRAREAIRRRTSPPEELSFLDPGGWTDDGLTAAHDFERMILDWDARNPDASEIEREEQIEKVRKLVLGRIDETNQSYSVEGATQPAPEPSPAAPPTPAPEAPPAEAPAEAPRANPQRPSGRGYQQDPQRMTPSQQQQPAPGQPEDTGWRAIRNLTQEAPQWLGATPPDLASLPQTQRDSIAAQAERLGIAPEEVRDQVWQKIKQWITGGSDTPANPEPMRDQRPAEQPAQVIDAAYRPAEPGGGPAAPGGGPNFQEQRTLYALGDSHGVNVGVQFGLPKVEGGRNLSEVGLSVTDPKFIAQLRRVPNGARVVISGGTNDAVGRASIREAASAIMTEARNRDIQVVWVGPSQHTANARAIDAELPGIVNGPNGRYVSVQSVGELSSDGVHFRNYRPIKEAIDAAMSGAAPGGVQFDPAAVIEAGLTPGATTASPTTGPLRGLLDLIGGVEAGGSYDILYSQRKPTYTLTGMTINEVLALQRQWVAGGKASSAAGRYQFLRKTLQGLVKQLGLSGNERFDAAMQDRLAIQLMRGRGLDDYLAGRISADRFANNLAKEWASLPVTSSGRSYYAGDGLNKALVSVAKIMAAVNALRARNSA